MNRLIEHQEFFNKHLGIVTGRPDEGTEGWYFDYNEWNFGFLAIKAFLYNNQLSLVCRAHSIVNEGYKYSFLDKSLITICSAANFREFKNNNNLGAVGKIEEDSNVSFQTFTFNPLRSLSLHPKDQFPLF